MGKSWINIVIKEFFHFWFVYKDGYVFNNF